MANIRVWTSQGQWPKDVITGLDKIDLIKAIILKEYCPNYDEDYELPGLELDGKSISSEDFDAEAYDTNLDCFWGGFESKLRAEKKTDLSKIRTLKVRLSTIKDMAAHSYLSEAYNAIIAAACVPTPTPANYCLMLKFE